MKTKGSDQRPTLGTGIDSRFGGRTEVVRLSTQSTIFLFLALFLFELLVSLNRDRFLGAEANSDAQHILKLVYSPFDAADLADHSFVVTARFYDWLGLIGHETLTAIVGVFVGWFGLLLVVYMLGGLPLNLRPLFVIASSALLGASFLGIYTKEVLIGITICMVVLVSNKKYGTLTIFVLLFGIGIFFRHYWILIAGLFLLFYNVLPRFKTTFSKFAILISVSIILGLLVFFITGDMADHYRVIVNGNRPDIDFVDSRIDRYFHGAEPLSGVLNVLVATFFIAVPIPLFMLGTPYHMLSAILIFSLWFIVLRACTSCGCDARNPVMLRYASIALAFLVVQGLFEPDYGSALRHLTPIFPVVLGLAIMYEYSKTGNFKGINSMESSAPLVDVMKQFTVDRKIIFKRYVEALKKLAWLIVIVPLIGGCVGYGIAHLIPKSYTSQAQLFVTSDTGGSVGDAYQGTLLGEKMIASYAHIAKGQVVLDEVRKKLDLQESADELKGKISVNVTPSTVLMQIQATDNDPESARDLANGVSEALIEVVDRLDRSSADDGSAAGLTVVSSAETPRIPSHPNKGLYAVLALIITLLCILLVIFIRVLVDRSIKEESEIADYSGLNILGRIPKDNSLAENRTVSVTGEFSPVAEAFREVRTNLRYVNVDHPPSLIGVTSPLPSDGKTTTTVNVAITLAAAGSKVCIVEADLRKPMVCASLDTNLQTSVGLSTVLSGSIDLDDVIQESRIPGIDVVAAGAIPPNPAELISSELCSSVLKSLKERYDYVLVDSAPLLPVTDGAVLSGITEGTIMVVRYGVTTVDNLIAGVDRLNGANAKIIGAVLSAVPMRSKEYGYYGQKANGTEEKKAGTNVKYRRSKE